MPILDNLAKIPNSKDHIDVNDEVIETPIYEEPICPNPRCKRPLTEEDLQKPTFKCPYCGGLFNNPFYEFDEERDVAPIPDIKLKWVRGQERIKFSRPYLYLTIGERGGGKSSMLEVIAVRYAKIIDMLEANDAEALCWCKPQFKKVWRAIHGQDPRILILHGLTKKASCEWDTLPIDELKLSVFEQYDVIILCHVFFADDADYTNALYVITHCLWEERMYWKEVWFVLVREAANWLYARNRSMKDSAGSKDEFDKQIREARHKGLAIGVDAIRWTDIEKRIRDIAEYLFIKKTGRPGLPQEISWMYRIFQPQSIRNMKVDRYVLVTGKENVGEGRVEYPSWHKEEQEDILGELKIQVVDVDSEGIPENQKTYDTSDLEHSQIVEGYIELKSTQKVSEKVGRSSRTVYTQIADHNKDIERLGECMRCKRAKSKFNKDFVNIPKRKRN